MKPFKICFDEALNNKKIEPEVSKDFKKVVIKAKKELLGEINYNANTLISYCVLKRLFNGESCENISINYTLIDKETNKVLVKANWPKEDYNIYP